MPSDLVKRFTATVNQNWETPQRLICHYDLFSQIARLQKAINKRTLFCCSADFICNVWKGSKLVGIQFLSNTAKHNYIVAGDINLPQRHCCAALNIFYIIYCDMWLNITQNHCCVYIAKMITRTPHNTTLYFRFMWPCITRAVCTVCKILQTVHTARVPNLHDCSQHNKAFTTRSFYIVCTPDDEHNDARNMLS